MPNRYNYDGLDAHKMFKKMGPCQAADGTWINGARVFNQVTQPPPALPAPPNVEITAFFFLRREKINTGVPDAYCLSVGVSDTAGINANEVYTDVLDVCRHMRTFPGVG